MAKIFQLLVLLLAAQLGVAQTSNPARGSGSVSFSVAPVESTWAGQPVYFLSLSNVNRVLREAFPGKELQYGTNVPVVASSATVMVEQGGLIDTRYATGLALPLTNQVTWGGLPPGTYLDASGFIRGRPTTNGQFSFQAQWRDANGMMTSNVLFAVNAWVPAMSATVLDGGSGYAFEDEVWPVGGAAGSVATFSVATLAVTDASTVIHDGGMGYVENDTVSIEGGATWTVAGIGDGGAVTALTCTAGGSYTANPGEVATTTSGSGEGLVLSVGATKVLTVTLTGGGTYYDKPGTPTTTSTSGGGSGLTLEISWP